MLPPAVECNREMKIAQVVPESIRNGSPDHASIGGINTGINNLTEMSGTPASRIVLVCLLRVYREVGSWESM